MDAKARRDGFKKLGQGMFVHYGLYSMLEQGEWTKNLHNIPDCEYEKLKDKFHVRKDFAGHLVEAAKSAGLKYITLTTRHHDGFSLYDTRGLDGYDAPHSACGRDIVAEFADECRRQGIVPFFYHTTLDWRRPEYKNDFPKYLQYLRDSVEILCRNYGKIGGLWFDGNWNRPNDDWEEDALYKVIRKYQPDAIIVNNTGLDAGGKVGHPELDSTTFERGRPDSFSGELGSEMCEVFGSHWGYTKKDINYKSMREILTSYMTCHRYGANFLLNAGPMADGTLRLADRAMLELFGIFTSTYKEALENVTPCGDASYFTLKNDKGDYFLCMDGQGVAGDENVTKSSGGNKRIELTAFPDKVKTVALLDNGATVPFIQDGAKLSVDNIPFSYGTDLVWRIAKITTK